MSRQEAAGPAHVADTVMEDSSSVTFSLETNFNGFEAYALPLLPYTFRMPFKTCLKLYREYFAKLLLAAKSGTACAKVRATPITNKAIPEDLREDLLARQVDSKKTQHELKRAELESEAADLLTQAKAYSIALANSANSAHTIGNTSLV